MSNRKRVDIAEWRKSGYLQEANRLFFHPHGLALEVTVADDGTESITGVWDSRDDPEGIVFGEVSAEFVANVEADAERHREARIRLMGAAVQPVDWKYQP